MKTTLIICAIVITVLASVAAAEKAFDTDYAKKQAFAQPFDVWHGNRGMIQVPSDALVGKPATIRYTFPSDVNPLIYKEAYIWRSGDTQWEQMELTGTQSEYDLFLSSVDPVVLPGESMREGAVFFATYVCTATVEVNGVETYACGCNEARIESCGLWNKQVFPVDAPPICGDKRCSPGENNICIEDCGEEYVGPPQSIIRVLKSTGSSVEQYTTANNAYEVALRDGEEDTWNAPQGPVTVRALYSVDGFVKIRINNQITAIVQGNGAYDYNGLSIDVLEVQGQSENVATRFQLVVEENGLDAITRGMLLDGETDTFTIDGQTFTIGVRVSIDLQTAEFTVDGQTLEPMRPADSAIIGNNVKLTRIT
jgi:hypothetical protein